MKYLKEKSEINMKSAELLDKNRLYASVIHCAYYSCFQLMKYIQINKMKINEDDLKKLKSEEVFGTH